MNIIFLTTNSFFANFLIYFTHFDLHDPHNIIGCCINYGLDTCDKCNNWQMATFIYFFEQSKWQHLINLTMNI